MAPGTTSGGRQRRGRPARTVAAVGLVVGLLAGCGGGGDDGAATSPSSSTTASSTTTTAPPPRTYTVEPGDTLTEIAAAHGVTVEAIVAANGIDDPDRIQVGQVFVIPEPGTEETRSVGTSTSTTSPPAG